MRFPGWRAVTGIALVAGLLGGPALMATAASAGTVPGGGNGLRAEFFTIRIVNDNNGQVNAYGPVYGRGTDVEQSNTFGVFYFDRGSVGVQHSDVSNLQPKINWRSCTATAYGQGNWKFAYGTGKFWGARGWGQFRIFEFIVLKRDKWGNCDTNLNDQPKYFQADVTAWGQAAVGSQHD